MQIIGLNMSQYTGTAPALAQMTAGRTMPWLRCQRGGGANDPSTTWSIPVGDGTTRAPLYREVAVLNHRNEVILSFELASQPIDGPTHEVQREVVREALRAAAALPDTDGDLLPDAWEWDEFGGLDAAQANTPTGSGLTAVLAYALGQSPHAALDTMGLRVIRAGDGLALSYTRRLSRRPAFVWSVERSQELALWPAWLDPTGGSATTQYDGTGTERVTHQLPNDGLALDAFRLLLAVRPDPAG